MTSRPKFPPNFGWVGVALETVKFQGGEAGGTIAKVRHTYSFLAVCVARELKTINIFFGREATRRPRPGAPAPPLFGLLAAPGTEASDLATPQRGEAEFIWEFGFAAAAASLRGQRKGGQRQRLLRHRAVAFAAPRPTSSYRPH